MEFCCLFVCYYILYYGGPSSVLYTFCIEIMWVGLFIIKCFLFDWSHYIVRNCLAFHHCTRRCRCWKKKEKNNRKYIINELNLFNKTKKKENSNKNRELTSVRLGYMQKILQVHAFIFMSDVQVGFIHVWRLHLWCIFSKRVA